MTRKRDAGNVRSPCQAGRGIGAIADRRQSGARQAAEAQGGHWSGQTSRLQPEMAMTPAAFRKLAAVGLHVALHDRRVECGAAQTQHEIRYAGYARQRLGKFSLKGRGRKAELVVPTHHFATCAGSIATQAIASHFSLGCLGRVLCSGPIVPPIHVGAMVQPGLHFTVPLEELELPA